MTEPNYPPKTISFGIPETTIDGMVIYNDSQGGLRTALRKVDGEWVEVHECTPPDPDRAETDTWVCPDCKATAVLKTMRWWEPLVEGELSREGACPPETT